MKSSGGHAPYLFELVADSNSGLLKSTERFVPPDDRRVVYHYKNSKTELDIEM